MNACVCVVPRDSEYLNALSRYPRERDWPDVRVTTFRRMIYSNYWFKKRLKTTLYTIHDTPCPAARRSPEERIADMARVQYTRLPVTRPLYGERTLRRIRSKPYGRSTNATLYGRGLGQLAS